MAGVVIVGAGQAGYQMTESLRQEGYEGEITLIGEESPLPYQRPPLSKDYLRGEMDAERLLYRPLEFYQQNQITLMLHSRVESLSSDAKRLLLSSGETVPYEALVLSTGARVRKIKMPGSKLDGLCYLRTLADVDDIGARLANVENIIVIGAGFIGLEFASTARKLGKNVTVLEAMDRVMARVVQPELSAYFTRLHEGHGVKILCNAMAEELVGNGAYVSAVKTKDGQTLAADLVVAGIGVLPNVELAAEAGISCDNGIRVDAFGQTSQSGIYAVGDCVSYAHPFAGRAIRLESVQNAGDQARATAAKIAGKDKPYTAVPWFWSDQYDVKFQMAGLTIECDSHIVRGDIASGCFSLLHFKGDQFRAVEAINQPRDYIVGRMLLEKDLSPTKLQAGDTDFNLKSLLKQG